MDSVVGVTKHPRLSVIMPVYNGEKYLREAVDSILGQTFFDFEFIIVNDGSSDVTADILSTYTDKRIKIIENDQNCGISISLNRGIAEAKGEYIARMDSDDISLPDRFMTQVQFLDTHPTIDILGCWFEVIDDQGRLTGKVDKYPCSVMGLRWYAFFAPPVAHPSVMIRRWVFDQITSYDQLEEPAEDFGLWNRINLSVRFANLQRVLLWYRVHESSISRSLAEYQKEMDFAICQKSINDYLDKNIPCEFVELIKLPHQVQSKEVYYGAIKVLRQLFIKFCKDYPILSDEMVEIDLDLANRLSQITYKNHQFISSWLFRLFAITIVIRAVSVSFLISHLPRKI